MVAPEVVKGDASNDTSQDDIVEVEQAEQRSEADEDGLAIEGR
jgi:hypothetical protein